MRIAIAGGLSALFFALLGMCAHAAEPDWAAYGILLKKHVLPGVRSGIRLNAVDYPALKADPRFPRVVKVLETFPVNSLAGRDERLAFYINAYNILAMKMVTDHWPLESIKDVGSPLGLSEANLFRSLAQVEKLRDLGKVVNPVWSMTAGRIGGRSVSLDEIENKLLRPMGEPRIHMAIVCASISCPDLRREPYTAAGLNEQLDDQVRRFLANTGKGLRLEDGAVRVSRIFAWFGDDFQTYGGVEKFIRHHRSDLPAGVKIVPDIDYNWNVNGRGKE